MNSRRRPPYLYVINGEKGVAGPATRLGLYDRFPGPNYWQISMAILIKVGLLATVCYVAYSIK